MSGNFLKIAFILLFAIGFMFIGLVASYILDFNDRKYYKVDSTWIEDTGALVGLDLGKSTSSKFTYSYRGKIYTGHSKYSQTTGVLGQEFIIKVNPQFPDRYVPLAWKPVFVGTEKTSLVNGQIIDLIFSMPLDFLNRGILSKKKIVVRYKIDGRTYAVQQALPPNYETQFSKVKKNSFFEVEYSENDPRMAIVHLDRPVNH